LALPDGIPSDDTIARVFARLDPQAFDQCFDRWVESITCAVGAQVIPIDGKTVRQSFDPTGKRVSSARETSCKDWTHPNQQQKAIHVIGA